MYIWQTNCAMEIPKGNKREDIKARRQIIKDFYSQWISEHPEKEVWNHSLQSFIRVKNISINEALGHAPRSVEATLSQFHLSEILADAEYVEQWKPKYGDKNQKPFSHILRLKWRQCRVLIGHQKTTGDLVLYYISGGQKKVAR